MDQNSPNIEKSNTVYDHIAIIVNHDSMDYCCCAAGQIIKINSIPFIDGIPEFKSILADNSESISERASIKVYINSPYCTFVPFELYDDTQKRVYLRNVMDLTTLKNYEVCVDEDKLWGLVCLYAYPLTIKSAIEEVLPQAQIFHTLNALRLTSLIQDSPDFVYCQVGNTSVRISVVAAGNLILNNYYKVKSIEDILYYNLLAYDQTGKDVLEMPLFVTGYVGEETELMKLLRSYVKNVSLKSIPGDKITEASLVHVDRTFFDLYIGSECA